MPRLKKGHIPQSWYEVVQIYYQQDEYTSLEKYKALIADEAFVVPSNEHLLKEIARLMSN